MSLSAAPRRDLHRPLRMHARPRPGDVLAGIISSGEVVLLLLVAAVAESVFANYLPWALYLDLPLVLTLYVGWYSTPMRGGLVGMVFGWLQDAILGSYLGLNGASKALLGFCGNYLNKGLVLEGLLVRSFVIAGLTGVNNALVLGLGALLGQSMQAGIYFRSLIELPVTGIIGGLIFTAYDRFKFPEKDFRYL